MISYERTLNLILVGDKFSAALNSAIEEALERRWTVTVLLLSAPKPEKFRFEDKANLKVVEENDLNDLLSSIPLEKTPNLVLFENETIPQIDLQTSTLTTDFFVLRFSDFKFKYGFCHHDPSLKSSASDSSGFTGAPEKRIFFKNDAPLKLNRTLEGIFQTTNSALLTSSKIINSYYTLAKVNERSDSLIDQALVQQSWGQLDYFDIAIRRLAEKQFSESVWAVSQALNFESKTFAQHLLAWINIQASEKQSLLNMQKDLTTPEMLGFPESAFLLSEIAGKHDLLPQQKELLTALISKLPNYSIVLQRLGRLSLVSEDYLSARTYYEKALSSDPYNPICLLDLSQIDLKENRLSEALQHIEQALLHPFCETRAYLQKAFIYRSNNDGPGTLACLEQFVEKEEKAFEASADAKQKTILEEVKREVSNLKNYFNN